MKIYKTKLFLLSSALSMVLFQACTDADNPIDQVYDGTQRGAVLRTIAVVSNELPIGQSTAGFAVDLEIQDVENGDLVETVNVYVRFTDNTIADGGTDFSKPEVAAGTIPRADFTIGSRGLPQTSYEIGLQTMQTLLGLADDQVDGGDVFRIRFELVLTDGRTYSLADNTATLTQTFFASPFVYNATVVCPPVPPTAGTWTINMQDSYGDGWQTENANGGGGLTLTLNDGTVFEVGLCSPYLGSDFTCTPGVSSGTATIQVPADAGISEWFFPGDFYGEISFQIITPNGNTVADIAPGAPAGVVAINFCVD